MLTLKKITVAGLALSLMAVVGCASSVRCENGESSVETAQTPAPTPAVVDVPPSASSTPVSEVPPVLNFTMNDIQGNPVNLADYQGKAILIVNVASKCGFTRQYGGLEALHLKYGPRGLVILGFPANNFGGQEPGSNEEIAQFCQANFGVTFPMFAKISVKGDDQAPLYQYLTSEEALPGQSGDVKWNFEKFLIGKDGKVIARFPSKVAPESPELIVPIEAALAQ